MKLKKATLQTLSVVTTVGLALGVAPAIADEGGGEQRIFQPIRRKIGPVEA